MKKLKLPYDTSAWKANDKAWMKARRAQWKDVNPRIKEWGQYHRDEFNKVLRGYFLTGELPLEDLYRNLGDTFNAKAPFDHMETVFFMECWLTADQSEDNWRAIRDRNLSVLSKRASEEYAWQKYHHSHMHLRKIMARYPRVGTALGDAKLEQRLYRFFNPTRCRREDYPQLSDAVYVERADNTFSNIASGLKRVIYAERPNQNSFAMIALDEMMDAINPAFTLYESSEGDTLKHMSKHLANEVVEARRALHLADTRPAFQVDFAQRFLEQMQRGDLVPVVRKVVDEAMDRTIEERNPMACPYCGGIMSDREYKAKFHGDGFCMVDWSDEGNPVIGTPKSYKEKVG